MIKLLFNVIFAAALLTTAERCSWEDIFGTTGNGYEEAEEVDTSTYNYSFTCAVGRTYTVPIPNRLSASCKANWEYYARTYGCNDADNFARAQQLKNQCP